MLECVEDDVGSTLSPFDTLPDTKLLNCQEFGNSMTTVSATIIFISFIIKSFTVNPKPPQNCIGQNKNSEPKAHSVMQHNWTSQSHRAVLCVRFCNKFSLVTGEWHQNSTVVDCELPDFPIGWFMTKKSLWSASMIKAHLLQASQCIVHVMFTNIYIHNFIMLLWWKSRSVERVFPPTNWMHLGWCFCGQ